MSAAIDTYLADRLGTEPLTADQLAERLMVARATVYNWRKIGVRGRKLPAICLGVRAAMFSPLDVVEFVLFMSGRADEVAPPAPRRRREKRIAPSADTIAHLESLGMPCS